MLRTLTSATGPVDLLEEFEKPKNPVWKALFPGDEEDQASFRRVWKGVFSGDEEDGFRGEEFSTSSWVVAKPCLLEGNRDPSR
jgi:hypothetical protein